MATIQWRSDVCNLPGRAAERGRKVEGELIVRISFVDRNSRREISRTICDRRRIGEYRDRFPRGAHGKDPQIPVAEVAVISLALKIGQDLYWPVRIRAQRRPRLHV